MYDKDVSRCSENALIAQVLRYWRRSKDVCLVVIVGQGLKGGRRGTSTTKNKSTVLGTNKVVCIINQNDSNTN